VDGRGRGAHRLTPFDQKASMGSPRTGMLRPVFPVRLLVLVVGSALLAGSLLVSALQVHWLEQREFEHEGELRSLARRAGEVGATRISARLTQLRLASGEQATFEVCAEGDLGAAQFQGALDFIVWRPSSKKLELKVALDRDHRALVKRAGSRSCLTLGGGAIDQAGEYAIDAVWAGRTLPPALANIPMRGRVLAKRPLGLQEGMLVLCAAVGAVLCALAGFSANERDAKDAADSERKSPLWAVAFSVLGMALFAAALRLPLGGALGGFARGLGVAAIEVGMALVGGLLVFRGNRNGLRLFAPASRPGLWLLAACGCALLMRPLSGLAMRLVPRTGEAPIEAFISWPSGALTFAMLGMVVPLAEELFFRGLLFGTLSPLGKPAAALGTIVLFTAAHAQQSWGNWGALVSVFMTGVVLTVLRALSGSTLVPAVAHVLFNLSLWRSSFGG